MRNLQSLRSRLVAAMILPALVSIGIAVLLYNHVDQGVEHAADQQASQKVANALAGELAGGAALPDRVTLRAALPNDQVLISIDGRAVFTGDAPSKVFHRQLELTATASFPHGTVTVLDYGLVGQAAANELIVVAAAPVLLLVLSAVAATSYLSRTLRRQIGNARQAADRVAAGDLSARMGPDARGEFIALAQAFDGMATRLETSDSNQRQFLGDLAHELATPVTAISGNGLALAEGIVVGEKARRDAGATLTRETRRLQGLLADLGSLTHMDLAQTVSQGPIAIDELCREIAGRFNQAALAADVRLTLRATSVTAISDRRLVDMIVANLVSNAIRCTPAGGTVRIDVRRQRDDIVIAVRDSGIGIAAEHQQRIFDRFYRVDGARQRATGGSGLGLSIAKRAADALHGRIELTSAPGSGSTFRLIFPVRTDLTTPSPAPEPRRRAHQPPAAIR